MNSAVFWFFIVMLPPDGTAHIFTFPTEAACHVKQKEGVPFLPVDALVTSCAKHPRTGFVPLLPPPKPD